MCQKSSETFEKRACGDILFLFHLNLQGAWGLYDWVVRFCQPLVQSPNQLQALFLPFIFSIFICFLEQDQIMLREFQTFYSHIHL